MRNFSGIIWGLVFVFIGVMMLLDRFGYAQFQLGEFLSQWWPLALVIVGLGMILDRSWQSKKGK